VSKHIGADDLTLPVKRTEGETIEERLTDNAYHNILPARYLRKDDEGELVESQEDLFERVARNVALAEAVFEARKRDIEVTVTPDQIKPDHPRRDELAAEVFGTGVTVDDDHERPLTEHNVNKFAYETVVPELPAEVREHVETTAAEFQETMEQLSFTPNCVPPDSLVAASGGLKPISGVEPGERVYDDESGAARVEHKYDNGEKRVVEIETESGYTVRATPEHYFRVITANGRYEWEQVKNIEPTDTLAVQKNFLDDDSESPSLDWQPTTTDGGAVQVGRSRGQFQPPAVMTDDLAEWLGLYIGDGTTRDSGIRVAFDDSDPDLLDHWVELTESVFGFEPTAGPHHNGACFVGRASRRDLTDFLDRNDLLKTNSGTATVPTGVLQSGRSGVAAFLRGLFEADGTVGDRQIELYTHSEQLGRQAQKLLLGLGIRSRLSEKRDGYRLSIRKNVCGKRFVDRVGFLSERKRERAARFTDVAENASSIEIPNQTERLQDWWQESELGLDAYRELSQFLSDPDSEYHQDIGKGIFERYADRYPELWDSPVAELVERDQFYERVERVTEVGTMAVEDMQVPRRNTYVVEGFVSHNSPTLMNAGDELQQLSACFVDSPADDIDEIHQTAKEAAQVFQCLTEESTVVTEQRGVISVSEVEAGDRIAQRTADGFQYKPVEETHEYADAETLTVQLANGLSVRGTPNHRLAVDDEWTRLDEIRAGQEVHYALGWLRETERQAPELASAGGAQWENSRSVENAGVVELYRKGLSDYESPDQLDCDKSTVQRRRSHEPELPPDGSGGRERGSASFDEDTALDLYREGHTDAEIAETLDVHQTTVGQFRARERLEANGTAVNAVSQPAILTEELAELVGLWLGDGSWHQDGVRFHVGRESIADYIDHLSRRLFGTSTSRTFADGCYEVEINSHEIKRWWRANFDCKPDGARSARVPQVVRKAPAETVEAFLRGYFTADGTLLNDTYPKLYSASERAIDDVATLMMGLGYPVEKSVTRDEEAHPYYGLIPTTGRGREAFLREVGFIDERRETGLESIGSVESRDASSGEYTVEVESVVESGEATVHDITVADNHQYVTDGIVSHNSGGGMGYAFWKLRPYGDPVGSTGGIASGPITFMRTYDQMCFPPGTRILTPSGQQPIEELDDRDLVIDENGDRQPVVETMERQIDEDIIEITPERLNRPIRATGEHPFRVARGDGLEWVDARDLRRDDLLVLGHASDDNGHTLDGTIDLGQIASGPLVFTDGGVRVNREYYSAKKGTTPQAFTDEVPVKDFATLAGWYLAEGCVVYRRGMPSEVTFTLHNDERDAAAEIQDALDSFGVSSRLDPVEERNTLHIHAEHSSFAQFVDSLFSTGASEKRVPEVLWNAPPETQARVLETLFAGDGRLEKRGKSQRVKLKLANETIIDFAFQAGLRCGVQFSRHDREPDNRQPTYEVGASISTALGTPLERLFDEVDNDFATRDRAKQEHGREVVAIDSVETVEYEGSVYNAEVAGTHTYVAEDLVVHNCETIAQGGARRGAQMGVMRVSHPDVIQFIHAKNKDVSLAHTLRLNDPDDFTHTSFADALEEARELIDDDGKVPEHLRNAVEGHLSNFNISVGITDEFMDAVKNNDEYTFTNPRTGEPHVATPQTAELYEMFGLGDHVEVGEVLSVPASIVWDHIIEGAHENGEPGVVYLERINKQHSFDVDEHPDHQILATNPCGEQPLEEYEACNLGHINLSTIVDEDAPDWRHWEAEFAAQYDTTADAVDSYLGDALEELNTRIEIGTQFLENVVTMSDFPVEEIEQTVREMRKIGLGIMGLAQLYVQLGVEYGSDVGDEIAKQVMMHINHRSKEASHELARDRGVFEAWDESKYADPVRYRDWFEHHTGESADDWEDGYPIRNHNTTTIAPTGTTSMVGNTTGGCEPIYSVAYYKNVSDDVQGEEMLVEFDDYFLRTLTHNDIDVAAVKEEATEQMAANEFDGVRGLSTVPDAIGELFVTTDDLSAKQHASVQCACQQGVDSSISKTTNAPHDSTVEDAKEVFEYIYDHGGKGVTYYRDGTRSKQVLTTRAQNTEFTDMDEEAVVEFIVEQIEQQFGGIEGFLEDDEIRSQFATDIEEMLAAETRRYAEKKARPDQLHGVTQRIETGYGKLYVTINEDPQTSEPFELFANTGHSGGFTNSFTDALAKTISIALRSGVDPEEVIDKLQGVRSPKVAWDKGEQINSIPDAFGTALRRYVDDEIDAAYPDQATLEETASGRRGAPEPETDGAGAVPEDRGAATIEADHQSVVDAGENPECPECGALSLYYSEGCKTCENCGWSEC